MMTTLRPLLITFLMFSALSMAQDVKAVSTNSLPVQKTDKEWREQLTPMQYEILRQKGTEYAFTGKYDKTFEKGDYVCAACGTLLYKSADKYDAHCGWPSFDKGVKKNIGYRLDSSHHMVRTEIYCKRCGGHLGHVFEDGPKNTTGKRHCVNSVSLRFVPYKSTKNHE